MKYRVRTDLILFQETGCVCVHMHVRGCVLLLTGRAVIVAYTYSNYTADIQYVHSF